LNFTFKGARIALRGWTSVIVCHCTGATDRQIRALVREGVETSVEIVRACQAGFDCGGCKLAVERVILESRMESRLEPCQSPDPARILAPAV
jgi:bacterioferritin-associated ferredoxin